VLSIAQALNNEPNVMLLYLLQLNQDKTTDKSGYGYMYINVGLVVINFLSQYG